MSASSSREQTVRLLTIASARLRSDLVSGSIGTFITRVASMALGFAAMVILSRAVGPSGVGDYAWAFAWASLLQTIASFGCEKLAIREMAALKARSDWNGMRGVVRSVPLLVLAGSLTVCVVALIFGMIGISHRRLPIYVLAVGTTPIMTLSLVRLGALQGLGRVVLSRIPDDVVRPAAFLAALVGITVLSAQKLTPFLAMASQALAMVIAFVLGAIFLRRALPGELRSASSHFSARQWTRLAVPLGLLGGVNALVAQIDTILLAALSTPEQVGLFASASRTATVVGVAEFAVNAAFLPIAARYYAIRDFERLKRASQRAGVGAIGLTVALGAPLLAGAPLAMRLFGSGFGGGADSLRILVGCFLISSLAGQSGAVLMVSGHVRPMVLGSVGALILDVALNVALAPSLGAAGASWAWFISICAWNLYLASAVHRRLGFSGSPLMTILHQRSRA